METSSQTDGQTTSSNVASENQVETQTEPVRNPEGVLNKNKELLGLNKRLGTKVNELEDLVKNFQENKQISEGQKDEVIESLRGQLKTLKGELKDTKDSYNWNTVESQVKQAALKEGCVDAEKLVRLINDEEFASLEVNDKFRVNADDLTNLLAKAKKENVFLFEEGSANINDITPSTKLLKKEPAKPLEQMSAQEIEAQLRVLDQLEKDQKNGR